TKAATSWVQPEGVVVPRNPIVGCFAPCCACDASGHAAAALPKRAMNSRRLMAVSGTNAQDRRSIALGKGLPMSALGQKRTFRIALAMSALPPKADIRQCWHVR